MKKRLIIILVLIIATIGGLAWWLAHRGTESTDSATIEAHTIPLIPKVAGYVTVLHIDDNQPVKTGDVLLEIDPRDYQISMQQLTGSLSSAMATLENTELNLKRMQSLNNVARSRKDLDDATTAHATAEANVVAITAQLEQATKNLTDTKLLAPADGVITERGVEQGAYVQPGQQLAYLVPPKRWVIANFKETQLDGMKPGQKVDIKVDAYPSLQLHGKVESIQHGTGARFSLFPPENATGNFVKIVQRVPVKISIDGEIPPGVVLGPGMSVVPTVHIDGGA